jgi:tripartite-type tricarboxylate transporter receptor subunit TctC
MRKSLASMVSAVAMGGLLVSTSASGQDNFYAGKRINIVVGGASGSGNDGYARLLARHMARHIPGNPSIVVQNLPGAGSLTAIQTVDSTAPRDGTTIVMFLAGLILTAQTNPDEVRQDFSKFAWLGSIGNVARVCYMWGATSVKTWDDLLKRNEVIMGDTGGVGPTFVIHRVLQRIFGIKLKSIAGYTGAAEQRLAIERGELQGDCPAWTSIPSDWLRDKKINMVVRFTRDLPQGAPEMPWARDLLADPEKQRMLDLVTAPDELGRPFILSKEVPPARIKLLRDAFDQTMKDPQFLADAAKEQQTITPISGANAETMVKELAATPPAVVSKVKEILAN